ncbi:MAG TPA: hypothetical protein VD764_05675 [Nocardioides sp.]|jgi:hypothetical protein|nr:hypothetical protein [Nocardioides sp.]
MNTTTTTIRRRIAFCTIAAITFPAFAACGAEIAPPAQDISRAKIDKQDQPTMPKRTTGNRFEFGDEYGTAEAQQRKTRPAGSGTRNRMDFRDDGR